MNLEHLYCIHLFSGQANSVLSVLTTWTSDEIVKKTSDNSIFPLFTDKT